MLTGTNNGMLIASLSVLQRRGWKSTSKLVRALKTLQDRGIIRCTKRCAPNVRHEASRYAFTDTPIPQQIAHGNTGCNAHRRMADVEAESGDKKKRAVRRRKATVPPEGKPRFPPEESRAKKPFLQKGKQKTRNC
jgi:hypothetical protein